MPQESSFKMFGCAKTARRYDPVDRILHNHRRKKLKVNTLLSLGKAFPASTGTAANNHVTEHRTRITSHM
jgi:hypothetical protein